MKWLENSCHGIPWLIGTVAMIYLGAWPGGVELWMNLLVYLLVDIVFVAVIKAFARRRRPSIQSDEQWFAKVDPTGVDKFSFPSGHVSRAGGFFFFFWFSLSPQLSSPYSYPNLVKCCCCIKSISMPPSYLGRCRWNSFVVCRIHRYVLSLDGRRQSNVLTNISGRRRSVVLRLKFKYDYSFSSSAQSNPTKFNTRCTLISKLIWNY